MRDHVLLGPGDQFGTLPALDRHRAIVDAQPLCEEGETKFSSTGSEIDFNVSASAAIVVVALEEAVLVAVVRVDIGAIDLETDLARSRPDQRAHACRCQAACLLRCAQPAAS